jgi:hypothetical protein
MTMTVIPPMMVVKKVMLDSNFGDDNEAKSLS